MAVAVMRAEARGEAVAGVVGGGGALVAGSLEGASATVGVGAGEGKDTAGAETLASGSTAVMVAVMGEVAGRGSADGAEVAEADVAVATERAASAGWVRVQVVDLETGVAGEREAPAEAARRTICNDFQLDNDRHQKAIRIRTHREKKQARLMPCQTTALGPLLELHGLRRWVLRRQVHCTHRHRQSTMADGTTDV